MIDLKSYFHDKYQGGEGIIILIFAKDGQDNILNEAFATLIFIVKI